MNGDLQYNTVEASSAIFEQLYVKPGESVAFFDCHMTVPVAGQDAVTEGIVPIQIRQLERSTPESFEYRNGDRIYTSAARFLDGGNEFPVNIVIRKRGHSMHRAQIIVSDEGNDEALRIQLFR